MEKSQVMPDYNNCIVNLMSSIEKSFGSANYYPQLRQLKQESLEKKDIAVIIIDGLGYNYLLKNAKNNTFRKGLIAKLSSVFPSTTASALTSFFTARAPAEHCFCSWYIFFKELGILSRSLPFTTRAGKIGLKGLDIRKLIRAKSLADRLNCLHIRISPQSLIKTPYTASTLKKKKGRSLALGYSSINGFKRQIIKAFKIKARKRKLIFAYWPFFDSIAHEMGLGSIEAKRHFHELEKAMSWVSQKLPANSAAFVTADHGFIDTEKSRVIWVNRHAKLMECLSMPLSGDARVAFCFVFNEKRKQFESYVKKELGFCCRLYKSSELAKKGIFGKKPRKELLQRIGDYTIIMKSNYIIKDILEGEEKEFNIGNHSGLSEDEMYVPLIRLC